MVDLSSIITQVKQGETMPTAPAMLPVIPVVEEVPKKVKGAFGGCCGGKAKTKVKPAAGDPPVVTSKENAVELQSVITLSTTIESTMMDDTLQIPTDDKQSLDKISTPPVAVDTTVIAESDSPKMLEKSKSIAQDNHSNSSLTRKRKSADNLTPTATVVPTHKDTDATLVPQKTEQLNSSARFKSNERSNISSEATSPVPSPTESPLPVAKSRLSSDTNAAKPPPKRMYFTKVDNWAPGPDALLPPPTEDQYNKKLLVLDLDETLVHSSFNKVDNADMVIPLSIEDPVSKTTISHQVYVYKRPYVDEFLETMAKYYELAIFTASLQVYCDAVMESLDPKGLCVHRLYRNSCVQSNGVFVKDMSILGRPIESIIILDNCAASYMFQPENGILAVAFYDDKTDMFLKEIEETMIRLSRVEDVRTYLRNCP